MVSIKKGEEYALNLDRQDRMNYAVTSNHIHLLVYSNVTVKLFSGPCNLWQAELGRDIISEKTEKGHFGKISTMPLP